MSRSKLLFILLFVTFIPSNSKLGDIIPNSTWLIETNQTLFTKMAFLRYASSGVFRHYNMSFDIL